MLAGTDTYTRMHCIHSQSVQDIMGAPAWSAEPETGTKLHDRQSQTEGERGRRQGRQMDGTRRERNEGRQGERN